MWFGKCSRGGRGGNSWDYNGFKSCLCQLSMFTLYAVVVVSWETWTPFSRVVKQCEIIPGAIWFLGCDGYSGWRTVKGYQEGRFKRRSRVQSPSKTEKIPIICFRRAFHYQSAWFSCWGLRLLVAPTHACKCWCDSTWSRNSPASKRLISLALSFSHFLSVKTLLKCELCLHNNMTNNEYIKEMATDYCICFVGA